MPCPYHYGKENKMWKCPSFGLLEGSHRIKRHSIILCGTIVYKTPLYDGKGCYWKQFSLKIKIQSQVIKDKQKGSQLCEHMKGRVNERLFSLSARTTAATTSLTTDTSSSFRKRLKSRNTGDSYSRTGDSWAVVMHVLYTTQDTFKGRCTMKMEDKYRKKGKFYCFYYAGGTVVAAAANDRSIPIPCGALTQSK